MAKVLILFAHPLLEKSRVHAKMIAAAARIPGVTINDLYERYPDFDIDVPREKELLLQHDIIIWQHPLYWYSAPPLLKQWQDLVLEHGWAYGKRGTALSGKKIFNAITSGGSSNSYREGGYNRFDVTRFLLPFEQTASLCHMVYWPPFWVPGVHRMEQEEIGPYARQYEQLLKRLTTDTFSIEQMARHTFINELVADQS